MSQNPKLTIGVALFATFIIGLAAGYILRGETGTDAQKSSSQDVELMESQRSEENRPEREAMRESRPESQWRNRESAERSRNSPDFQEMKNKMIRELKLNDEEANQLFDILRHHRMRGRELFQERRGQMRADFQELKDQLEEDISAVLDEEQMEIWQEEFSLNSERQQNLQRNRPFRE